MSEAIIFLGLIIAWNGALLGTVWYWSKGRQSSLKIIFSVATFLFLVCLFAMATETRSKNSCLEYETTMVFDAVTKTIIPIRSCKKYVERVKEQDDE